LRTIKIRGGELGQKTHPVGFRLQVKKNWSSTWFPGKSFASGLEEDSRIRKYIKARLPNAGISKVEISRTTKTVTITIHTARPGIVIGKGGEEVNRLKDEMKQLTEKKRCRIEGKKKCSSKYFGNQEARIRCSIGWLKHCSPVNKKSFLPSCN